MLPVSKLLWIAQRAPGRAFSDALQKSLQAQGREVAPFCHRAYSGQSNEAKKRLVILGTGWGGSAVCRDIDTKAYNLTVVSSLNHLTFTPLLPGAAVGTVEPRNTAVNIFNTQPVLRKEPNAFYAAKATAVDPKAQTVTCQDLLGADFTIGYDALVVATGSQGSTFGIPGVEEHALFLRNVANASAIRDKLIENWQIAGSPARSEEEKLRLLHTVIIGGGPTGVEFAGELSDFINHDLHKLDPDRASKAKVTIVEAQDLLGNFDASLREYAGRKLAKEGIQVIKGMVSELKASEAVLKDGTVIPYGTAVWSTGVGPTPFITALPFAKTARGRLAVDESLRVLVHPEKGEAPGPDSVDVSAKEQKDSSPTEHLDALNNVFALGDCCATIGKPLPALAQVAEQQGRYLAKALNARRQTSPAQPFKYKSLGSMATIGSSDAIIELGSSESRTFKWKGVTSFLAWRSAYLTRLGSTRNRLGILNNWIATALMGRDVSRW